MRYVEVGHRWDRVTMEILDMLVTTPKGNRYVLVMADCFSRWTEACPLPNKPALAVADALFQLIVCRFGMPAVIHSDQGREFENNLMQELCLLCCAHKTRTTQNSHTTSIGPPADRTLLSGGASVDSGRLIYNPEGSVVDVSSGARDSVVTFLLQVFLVDTTVSLHPFCVHGLDFGPIHLTTIAHVFNYRVAVLRDGAKSAARVGRSQRVAGRFLEDVGLPWGHQVAVMFQIVRALALEVHSVLRDIESLHGLSPNVILPCEPWGHVNHRVVSASLQTARVPMFMACR